MTEPDRPTPTTVVFDLGNVLIGWDQTGPLADRMSADEWHSFAEAADFPTLNTAADSGVPITDIVARAAEADPRHGEIVAGYYENFDKSLTGPISAMWFGSAFVYRGFTMDPGIPGALTAGR